MATSQEYREEQVVVFELAGEAFGVEIGRVQEINRMLPITSLPESPDFVRGVINLRGHVTPVVDLRRRFGLPHAEETAHSRIVVVMSDQGEWVGVIVDAVSEVLRMPLDAIEPPASMVVTSDQTFLRGIAKLSDRMVIMLDLDRVLSQNVAGSNMQPAPA
jgi:purine-binding chemotaxis protein CheW